ncbi:putative cation efflux protein, cytoplasmic [Helianthus annuus]|nr:putative cation efflux protein, cytoplasmic [Helianthus annuus]
MQILTSGLSRFKTESILELVDAAIPSHHLDPIRKTVLQVKGVEGCRHLRGRRAGSSLYLDVKIEVDPCCSISVAHQIGESVRYQIQSSHPEVSEVFIQLEPATKQEVADVTCDSGDLMLEDDRIEEMVNKLLPNMFSEKTVVKSVRKRKLEDKFLLEVEVSMPVDALIRSDEMKVPVEYRSLDLQVNIANSLKDLQHKE